MLSMRIAPEAKHIRAEVLQQYLSIYISPVYYPPKLLKFSHADIALLCYTHFTSIATS
jgi:exoribonuclease R